MMQESVVTPSVATDGVPGRKGMPRPVVAVLLAVLTLASCSDDSSPTAPTPPPPPPESPDRPALVALYNATGGANWDNRDNWLTTSDIGTWHGVETNAQGLVTELSLENNNLSGAIPAQLGDLTQLRRLVLYSNELTGNIPPELGKLSNVTRISLSSNSLTGSLPPGIGSLANLDTLILHTNELSGSIPTELGNLASLENLSLALNSLSGTVPPELGRLAKLKRLTFSRNQLTGTIPPELAGLSSIETLSLSRNDLTGPIPGELGDLATLEALYLYQNQLSGEIPPELASLSKLELLRIEDNDLTGAIPAELGGLRELATLSLSNNALSGPLPPEIGDAGSLASLVLAGNADLRGLLPRNLLSLDYLVNLLYLDTDLCAQIDGEFQAWLQAVRSAEGAECDPGKVERLALTHLHDVTAGASWENGGGWATDGPAGNWHGVTVEGGRVVELILPDNGLAGPLPPEMVNFIELRAINFDGNDLFGEIPPALASLSDLHELRVADNPRLEGPLPFAFRRLQQLRVLHYGGTSLCASPSASFQAWFSGIGETDGATCGNPEEVSLSVPVVYLTQSVQDPSRGVRLIAGREALLRAFVTAEEPRAFFEPTAVAVFSRSGEEVHRVVMSRDDDQIPTATDEGDLGQSYNAVIPAEVIAPGVRLVVEVDPEEMVPRAPGSVVRFPATGADSLRVVVAAPMVLTTVPVLEATAPDSSVLEWTSDISGDSPQVGLLKYAFPFADFTAQAHATYVTSLDLTDEDAQWELVLELEALRTAESGTGYYYGVASSTNGFVRGRARIGGWASMGKALVAELAHEVGHNLDLNHAPCGGALGWDRAFPYPDGSIGVWGYDFRDGSLLSPERRRDIMGYCYERGWLSDYYFEKVIDYREGLATDAALAPLGAAGTQSDVLVLWGGVVGGQLRIEPAFQMRAATSLPEASGPYRIQGRSVGGEPVFSLDFTPGEDEFGDKYFFFTIPIEADWTETLERITLTGPEGLVTVDRNDERALSVVTERSTGRIRAILRDWDGPLPAALGRTDDLGVVTTRGLGDAVRLR